MRTLKTFNDYKHVADETIKSTIAWDAIYNAVHVVDDTSVKRGLFYLYLGYLSAGETVKVEFECMSDGDGTQVQFNRYSNGLYQNEVNVYKVNVAPSPTFTKKSYTFTAETDAYYVIAVGSPGNFVSDFYLRNLSVDEPNTKSNLSQRLYEFTITDGVITTSDTSDNFTLSQGTIDKRYAISYEIPFGKLNSVSGIFPTKSAGNPNPRLDCLPRGANRLGCTIQFFDNATGDFLTWAQVEALTGTYYFSLLVTGYDI